MSETKTVPVDLLRVMADQRLTKDMSSDELNDSDFEFAYDTMVENARLLLNYNAAPSQPVDGNTSDGYHTFNELYAFRLAYNAALFNEWARLGLYEVHKSYRHHGGDLCFGGGWFIVVAILPEGQISNHYKNEYWDQFQVPAHEKALHPYDGHTGADVLQRLKSIPSQPADDELARLKARIERLMLAHGREQARCATFMTAIAAEARNGRQEWAQNLLKLADKRASDVKLKDFVVATLS